MDLGIKCNLKAIKQDYIIRVYVNSKCGAQLVLTHILFYRPTIILFFPQDKMQTFIL